MLKTENILTVFSKESILSITSMMKRLRSSMDVEKNAVVGGFTVERLVNPQTAFDPQKRIDSLCCGVFIRLKATGERRRNRSRFCLSFQSWPAREVITLDTDAGMTGVVIRVI